MIEYKKYKLNNGLTVILHSDDSTPLVTVNVLYKVGSKHEHPHRTGFAHLFEHLMFGGSAHVPDYDIPIQEAGGDNNAFTNNDITNFYNILPFENLETALWLESDRMMHLKINQRALDIQKKVVLEEFSETSLNQPYGNMWHILSETAYSTHPYKWPTIGKEKAHIEKACLDEVSTFYQNNYKPNNAILVIAGNIDTDHVREQVENWFGGIPSGEIRQESILEEPAQSGFRQRILKEKVPSDAIFMAFHMPERMHRDFAAYDVLSDILSGGRSSRFHRNLLRGTDAFSSVSAYITGTVDPGLFIVEAKLLDGHPVEEARELVWHELNRLVTEEVSDKELQKVKNSLISSISFSEVSIVHKAINLAYYEMLGDADIINRQESEYAEVSTADIQRIARDLFRKENCSEITYLRESVN